MKLWFAIPLGWAMLTNPMIAEWFVFSCLALFVIFGLVAVVKSAQRP